MDSLVRCSFFVVSQSINFRQFTMPRKCLTLKEKIAILDKIKSQPPTTTVRELATITGVSKDSVSRLKANELKLREEWRSQERCPSQRKRRRAGKDPEVDEALNLWFGNVIKRGVRVSGPMLKEKAVELARRMGHDEFVATDGWLSRWKNRRDIKFKKAHGEKASANSVEAEKWSLTRIPALLERYALEDIYNADETGLYFRATPDGSLTYRHEQIMGSKKAMDRVTVLCCCNATGSDKRKLLLIGKAMKPRCFKNINRDNLPVSYYANKNAWMTSALFSKWLDEWDAELQKASRKILLLIDNATSHQTAPLKNIHIEFLPPNTTSLIQPLDMGIIKNLKVHYRAILVHNILQEIEDNTADVTTTAKDLSSKVSLLQAIQFVADSWRRVTSQTIINCFGRCGFKSQDFDNVLSPAQQIPEELTRVSNFEEYANIDVQVPCCSEEDNLDDEIIEQVSSNTKTAEIHDDDDPAPVRVTTKEAKKCIDSLRLYFMQLPNNDAPARQLDECADFIHQHSINTLKQSSIDDYFKS